MKQVKVKLKATHPHPTMRTRLADGTIIEVDKTGAVIPEDQVSWEMRQCACYEYEPAGKAEKAKADGDGEKLPTREELEAMPMSELREIGNRVGVKDNKKDELIEKILAAPK